MMAINIILLLIVLSICNGKLSYHEKCSNDTINFATKVDNSSIVVYGKTLGKLLYAEDDAKFYVLFQVDCIFKGPEIDKQINITQAGYVKGKKFCQEFPLGQGNTIAFLERNPLNKNDSKTFIPSDFVEIPFTNNLTDELLTKTCYLHQLLPFESNVSIHDVCPAVSTDSHCMSTTIYNNIELTSIHTGLLPIIIPGGSKHDIDNIRSKSGTIQVNVDKNNGITSINISIILILIASFFVQFN